MLKLKGHLKGRKLHLPVGGNYRVPLVCGVKKGITGKGCRRHRCQHCGKYHY